MCNNGITVLHATHIRTITVRAFTPFKPEVNFSQGSAAALCRWGGQISNFCVAYFLDIFYAKYCSNRSACIDTALKWTDFFDSYCK